MRVLENKVKPKLLDWPKEIKCRHCGSTLLVYLADLKNGVKGFVCPCCGEFNAL